MAASRFSCSALALLALPAFACGGDSGPQLSAAAEIGRRTYQNVCIACHNGDPSVAGNLGPAVAGASLELLEAKVLHGEYPPGYEPKRPDSAAMPTYPYVEERIEELAAFLAEVDG